MMAERNAVELCAGSGGYPAERVILDTVPGMNPSGTCPTCHRSLTLAPFRLPDHEAITETNTDGVTR